MVEGLKRSLKTNVGVKFTFADVSGPINLGTVNPKMCLS